jgi:hypothetical protein
MTLETGSGDARRDFRLVRDIGIFDQLLLDTRLLAEVSVVAPAGQTDESAALPKTSARSPGAAAGSGFTIVRFPRSSRLVHPMKRSFGHSSRHLLPAMRASYSSSRVRP